MSETDDRLVPRRRVRRAVAWTVSVAVAAGAVFWMSGGWDAWRHDAALDSACEGDLAAGELRALLGGAEVTTSGGPGERAWWCRVRGADDEDGRVRLDLSVRRAGSPAAGVEADREDAPLGHGWTGSFGFSPDGDAEDRGEARVTVMLDCGTEPGDGLVASVSTRIDRADFSRAVERDRLTAVLTGTAVSYARRTGCEAAPGRPVKDVGMSVTSWDHRPFAEVSGSCAGVLDAGTAARWGVRTAVETVPGPKPVEGCALGGTAGTPLYGFTAFYGPFLGLKGMEQRDDARLVGAHRDGRYMLAASCPGAGGKAVYEVASRTGAGHTSVLALDHPGLRAALRRFAEKSAKAHGCGVPTASSAVSGN
ncbi:hypothetical protein ACIGBL_21925 [Streptomyces sp. NPDC085614]|uniref:hypothetical protein n=1 Tax=Streptomyces sp. NPDC085614 TaxID=3365733 RepID=UPI0037D8312E